jgi:large subunit ribosomal protein L16
MKEFPIKKFTKFHGKFKFSGINENFQVCPVPFKNNANKFVVKSCEYGVITHLQLASVLSILKKKLKKRGVVISRIFAFLPRTSKPLEVRMGKGKGGRFRDNAVSVQPGQVLFEISGVSPIFVNFLYFCVKKKISVKTYISKQYFY